MNQQKLFILFLFILPCTDSFAQLDDVVEHLHRYDKILVYSEIRTSGVLTASELSSSVEARLRSEEIPLTKDPEYEKALGLFIEFDYIRPSDHEYASYACYIYTVVPDLLKGDFLTLTLTQYLNHGFVNSRSISDVKESGMENCNRELTKFIEDWKKSRQYVNSN